MEAIDVVKNLINVWSSVIASLCYCYYISAKVPKGMLRLISLLPILYLFTILPLHIPTSVFATSVTTFFITWLANFKLVLFAFDHGPLSWHTPKSLPTFVTIAALPIKIKQHKNLLHPQKKKLPLNLATEMLAFAVLVRFIILYNEDGLGPRPDFDHYNYILRPIIFQKYPSFLGPKPGFDPYVHQKILLLLYCCLLFLLIDILVALSGYVVKAVMGLELEPPSNEPYLSTSLQDFWGRRWNLTVTSTLRHTVYNPVRTGSVKFLGNEWAPPAAVLASFLVSGLMHELLFYYVTRARPSWDATLFFVLHGMCVVLEFRVKRACGTKLRLPWFVSGPLTLGFVVATSFWLFFPPLTRNGADAKVLQEFRVSVVYLKSKAVDLCRWLAKIFS